MTVYVDDMHQTEMGRFGRMKMSHMIADTHRELVEMADRIGVQRKWIQKAGTAWEHFDVSLAKRALAVEHGAQEITMRELVAVTQARQVGGEEALRAYLDPTPCHFCDEPATCESEFPTTTRYSDGVLLDAEAFWPSCETCAGPERRPLKP